MKKKTKTVTFSFLLNFTLCDTFFSKVTLSLSTQSMSCLPLGVSHSKQSKQKMYFDDIVKERHQIKETLILQRAVNFWNSAMFHLLNWLVTCFWENRFSGTTVLLKCFSREDRMMASSSGFLTRPASSMYPEDNNSFIWDFNGTQASVGAYTEMSDEPHHHQPSAAASPERPPSAPPAGSGLPSGTDLWEWWSHVSPQTQKIPCVRTGGGKHISRTQLGSTKTGRSHTGYTGSTTITYQSAQLPEGLAWPWPAWCSRSEAGCTFGGGWSPALHWAARQSAAPQSGSWKPWRAPGEQLAKITQTVFS